MWYQSLSHNDPFVFTTLGIFQGLLGALKFEYTAFADWGPNIERNAFFKIFTGLDHDDLWHAGGQLPDTRLFDYHGKYIDMARGPGTDVKDGSSGVYWSGSATGQPVYTLFTANNDAICVAFATVVWPGLLGRYGWVGDWGSECAGNDTSIGTWYFSKIAVPGTKHFPNCLWIDKDGGQPATAFQVNWLDMAPDEGDTRIGKKAHDMCQTPSFKIYQHYDPDTIISHDRINDKQHPDQGSVVKQSEPAPHRKRSKSRRTPAEAKFTFEQMVKDVLIVDDVPSHTAHALCKSNNSAGPSFVNPEDGYFCDMQTKTIHPVCKGQNGTSVCLDMERRRLVGPGILKRSVPYEVKDWRLSRKNGTAESQGA